MRLIVTGGCGFIGSEFVRQALARPEVTSLVNIDLLTYAGNPENLAAVASDPRYRFVQADIADEAAMQAIFFEESQKTEQPLDAVVNFAAESHVDRSILSPQDFIRTNINGTSILLEKARAHAVKRFIQVSTDEVYGSLGPEGYFTEETPLHPNSPYSASKAAILGAMKPLALEVSKHKIRVNALCPGVVRGGLFRGQEEWLDKEVAPTYPLGLGEPEDVAHASVFFMSRASSKVTGTDFSIDGGVPFT
jgi:nucleoside-diphosphate-sugar epimerase